MIQIHGTPPSPFARKVVTVLEEKGVPYETVPTMPFPKSPELLAKHPLGLIPILQDGDLMLPDSSVMCAYLERKHPEPALLPADPADAARALWFEEWSDTALARAVGGIFFQRFVRKRIFQQEPDEAAVKKALEEDLPPLLDYLEENVAGRDFLVGERLSLADVSIACQLVNVKLGGEELDAKRWPEVARWYAGITGRPSLKTVLAGEGAA
ncbi:MAG: glutathione S-transferase family protein [Myxococcota bacterium]